MTWLLETIVATIPWWVWAVVGVVVLAALHRLVGWRGVIPGAGAIGGLFLFKRGQSVGESRILKKEIKDAEKAIERAKKVRADADKRNADPKRLRDDDGFKRND